MINKKISFQTLTSSLIMQFWHNTDQRISFIRWINAKVLTKLRIREAKLQY